MDPDLRPFGLPLFGICTVNAVAVAVAADPKNTAWAVRTVWAVTGGPPTLTDDNIIYIDLMPCGVTMIGLGDDWRNFVLGIMGLEGSVP